MKAVHLRRPAAVAVAAAVVAAVCACTPAGGATPTAAPSAKATDPPPPRLITVRLDVSGVGRGNIRFSSDRGTLIARDIVLTGWRYEYLSRPSTPIVLEVQQSATSTADCAVHINGRLHVSVGGSNPSCSVQTT